MAAVLSAFVNSPRLKTPMILQRAVDLDRHRNPDGDRVNILREGLELHVAAAEKRKADVCPRSPKRHPVGL